MPMNIDNPWDDVTPLSLSKPSMEIEPLVDGHATMANMSSVDEEFVPTPTVNIHETTAIMSGVVMDSHSSATIPTETMENPWSEAPKMNTACTGTSLWSHLGKHSNKPYISSKVVLKELDYSSSLHDDLYKFMQEQMKERNELIKAFEGAHVTIEKEHSLALAQVQEEMGDGARAFSTYEKHVEQELHDHDMTIANQRAMLE
ncbi:hypothetical protein F5141DRAFT_1208369 [Pisolithus sp. B1]|nr:hypothetical protein F5141DRAFT_1208369 [Pisolithus sp. B1]